jgi:predicted neuraminidase
MPVRSEFIFNEAPFPSCHASTIVETRTGTLLAAWFGGSHEGANDCCIYLSRKQTPNWSTPIKIVQGLDPDNASVPCWNPVLFETQTGHLLLFYKAGNHIQTWKGFLIRSQDDGQTWTPPEPLPKNILGPIKNKPIELDGKIIAGSSEEQHGWTVHFEWSPDEGKTWDRTPPLNEPNEIGAIQPCLLPAPNRVIKALGRTNQGKVFYTESQDHGHTWDPLRLLDVPNPNSGIDAVTLKSGEYVLAYNDSETKRTPLALATSQDGITWRRRLTLESEHGEFSYPATIQTRDGQIHVTYTWNRTHIKHVVLDVQDLV